MVDRQRFHDLCKKTADIATHRDSIGTLGEIPIGFCCAQIGKSMCYTMTFAEITESALIEEEPVGGEAKTLCLAAAIVHKLANIS